MSKKLEIQLQLEYSLSPTAARFEADQLAVLWCKKNTKHFPLGTNDEILFDQNWQGWYALALTNGNTTSTATKATYLQFITYLKNHI